MKRIFEYIGGIPIRLRFDNMTTAVAQVLKDGERVLTDGFTRFMLHCIFRADFCNPASGNEKGNVEKKVGYSRRNASASVPSLPRLRNLINGFGSGTKRTPTGSTTNTRFPRLLSQELAVICALETYTPDWNNGGYTRQRENEEYEPRQLDYDTGLPMEKAVRNKLLY